MKKFFIGIIVGIICGMFASGGGLLLVPVFTYILGLEEKEARATSLFCILPMVVITAVFYRLEFRNKMCNRWNYRRNNWWKIIK